MKKLLVVSAFIFFSTLAHATPSPTKQLATTLAGSYILTAGEETLTIDINNKLEGVVWTWNTRDVRLGFTAWANNISDEGLPRNYLITLNLPHPNSKKTLAVYLTFKEQADGQFKLYFQDVLEFEGQSAKKLPDSKIEKRVHRSGLTEELPQE